MSDLEVLLWMLYPELRIVEHPINNIIIIPNINLPHNFRDFVPRFYELKRDKEVEQYAKTLEETAREMIKGVMPIQFQWSEQDGLTHLGMGIHGGLYLDAEQGIPSFVGHNLNYTNGLLMGLVAMQYVSKLLKSR